MAGFFTPVVGFFALIAGFFAPVVGFFALMVGLFTLAVEFFTVMVEFFMVTAAILLTVAATFIAVTATALPIMSHTQPPMTPQSGPTAGLGSSPSTLGPVRQAGNIPAFLTWAKMVGHPYSHEFGQEMLENEVYPDNTIPDIGDALLMELLPLLKPASISHFFQACAAYWKYQTHLPSTQLTGQPAILPLQYHTTHPFIPKGASANPMAAGISDLSQGHIHSELSPGPSPITQVDISKGSSSPSNPFSAPPEHRNASPTKVDDDDGWVTVEHQCIDADGVITHGLLEEDETLVGAQEDTCNQGDTYVMQGTDVIESHARCRKDHYLHTYFMFNNLANSQPVMDRTVIEEQDTIRPRIWQH
ncbi:hypothetical protein BS47DRAFT_1364858 [Hydnum rufescens UP504]|uniref:Uncharacterized protein n=1 Tax=Hydnum rufescens UP504 TaxID=1448309 RepID=A0A9P6DQE6_9AGAM|nr:hypothetical protein BS47DRAFT_1364858 [Hydnum rufescens UP504]